MLSFVKSLNEELIDINHRNKFVFKLKISIQTILLNLYLLNKFSNYNIKSKLSK